MSARRRLQVLLELRSNRFSALLPLLFLCFPFLNYYLSCRQPGNRDAERRCTDVVHADGVAEFYAVGVATMLTANADLQFVARLATLFDAPAHEHAHALGIERLERVGTKDSSFVLVHV